MDKKNIVAIYIDIPFSNPKTVLLKWLNWVEKKLSTKNALEKKFQH